MVGVFDILYLPLRSPLDYFLLCYEHLEAEKTRLYPSSSPGLWLLLEFGQWQTKEIVESVEKEIRGLIISSDSFLAGSCQISPLKPKLWLEALTSSCSYVQDSLETAISILFFAPWP